MALILRCECRDLLLWKPWFFPIVALSCLDMAVFLELAKKISFSAVCESTQRYLSQTATSTFTKDWFGIVWLWCHRCFRFWWQLPSRGLMSSLCYLPGELLPGWINSFIQEMVLQLKRCEAQMLCHLSLPVFLLSSMLPAMSLHNVVLHKERWMPRH